MDEYYHSTVCHICKTFTSNLKRCSQCKLYVYCSKHHQKMHWNKHKQFCNMIYALLIGKNRQHILDIPVAKDLTSDQWKQMKVDLKLLWEHLLKRNLTHAEDQVWMFPRVCEVCHNAKQEILFECILCLSVSYCCKEHQQSHFYTHNKFCPALKLCYEINSFLHKYDDYKNFTELEPNIGKHVEMLPENTDVFVRDSVILMHNTNFSNILAADVISPFLTMVFALQSCNLLPERQYYKNSIVIHVVGISKYELCSNLYTTCKFFFYWIKNLTKLTLILIGPELKKPCKMTEDMNKDKSFSLVFEKCYYHEYVNSDSAITPDLITAFNCGLHEHKEEKGDKDTWAKSINFLIVGNTPFVMTSYTAEEAQKDLDRFKHLNFDIIAECRNNDYKGSRPIRNWESSALPIFYQNNYITVLKPR